MSEHASIARSKNAPATVGSCPRLREFLQVVARRKDQAFRRNDDDMDAVIRCQLIRGLAQTVHQFE